MSTENVKQKILYNTEQRIKESMTTEDYELYLKHQTYINSDEFKIPYKKLLNRTYGKFAYTTPERIFYKSPPRSYG